ncbi:MAG: TlyA family RNA methyltransferase [Microthrixaceae bacterium]|nr:TlyA family RNA methyltransferase [Microthrixaceae bacterium]
MTGLATLFVAIDSPHTIAGVRRRLDADLVRRGLVPTRTQAQDLIAAGRVLVGGAPVDKAARMVGPGESIVVEGPPRRFVGRGGEKLAGAIERFGLDFGGARVLDAGASTGGFTDCALQHGAREVVALDVGYGQLHPRLRDDPRVVVMERTNLRAVDPSQLGPFDAVVADLSFISLKTVLGRLVGCAAVGAPLMLLVKPQFEAGRAEVSRGRGVVRDPEVWRSVLVAVLAAATDAGARIDDLAPSPLRGAEGNVEFLMLVHRLDPAAGNSGADFDEMVDRCVAEAEVLGS